jgi:hypothetical protein
MLDLGGCHNINSRNNLIWNYSNADIDESRTFKLVRRITTEATAGRQTDRQAAYTYDVPDMWTRRGGGSRCQPSCVRVERSIELRKYIGDDVQNTNYILRYIVYQLGGDCSCPLCSWGGAEQGPSWGTRDPGSRIPPTYTHTCKKKIQIVSRCLAYRNNIEVNTRTK